jgi:hypothetical protein
MLDALADRLQLIFKNLSRRGVLSETDVDSTLREVRLALLEADVHFTVVKDFLVRVRERAVGSEVSRALNPAQQVLKIVHEELAATLGPAAPWSPAGPKPRVVMLLGLPGNWRSASVPKASASCWSPPMSIARRPSASCKSSGSRPARRFTPPAAGVRCKSAPPLSNKRGANRIPWCSWIPPAAGRSTIR